MNSLTGNELLAPLISRAVTGLPRVEDRQVINGMVYKISTGISWRDFPERYGRGRPCTPASAATPLTGCSPQPCSRSRPMPRRPATRPFMDRSAVPFHDDGPGEWQATNTAISLCGRGRFAGCAGVPVPAPAGQRWDGAGSGRASATQTVSGRRGSVV
ncbi:transposase [Streptomyces sp. NPDC051207]|uniref:transposase n=1 Tax=Streptomyces sp. NPDC051207 TaxID=3154641 RepID=UPI003426BDF0